MKKTKRVAILLLVMICAVGLLVGCGGKKAKNSSDDAVKYIDNGSFAIPGASDDLDYTNVCLYVDGEDFGFVGGGMTKDDGYIRLVTNASVVSTDSKQENAHEVEFRLYGSESLEGNMEESDDYISQTYYVSMENDNAFEVEQLISTNEKLDPIEW